MAKTTAKDDGMLISPQQVELPDVPSLSEVSGNMPALNADETDEHRQTKLLIGVLVLCVIVISSLTIFGLNKIGEEEPGSNFLVRETASLAQASGDVLTSSDNGTTWQTASANLELKPGMRIKTPAEVEANVRIGESSQITLEPGAQIAVNSLNSALVAMEHISGTVGVQIAPTTPWSFELRNNDRSVSGKTRYQSVISDTDWNLRVESGNLKYNGQEFSGNAFIAKNGALKQ